MRQATGRRVAALEAARGAGRPLRTFIEELDAPGWYSESGAGDGRLWSWAQVEGLAESGSARVVRVTYEDKQETYDEPRHKGIEWQGRAGE